MFAKTSQPPLAALACYCHKLQVHRRFYNFSNFKVLHRGSIDESKFSSVIKILQINFLTLATFTQKMRSTKTLKFYLKKLFSNPNILSLFKAIRKFIIKKSSCFLKQSIASIFHRIFTAAHCRYCYNCSLH
jgi:hypothetical protein